MNVLFASPVVLDEAAWRARREAHRARVSAWTAPHRARAGRGEKHPVYDFLFTYYGQRPSGLERWRPGLGITLAGGEAARAWLADPAYRENEYGVALDPAAWPEKRRAFVAWLHALLTTVRDRPAFYRCFGTHEWAMVYRQTPEEVRHNAWPLRFAPAELAAIVERNGLGCSHYDAFRFFTAPARSLNRTELSREAIVQHEQGGCLHANMDLYKWAFKLAPWTSAELEAECFALARDIREWDMRASPYDLRALGFAPVPIETPAGKAEYEREQRAFAARAVPLRAALIAVSETLLTAKNNKY